MQLIKSDYGDVHFVLNNQDFFPCYLYKSNTRTRRASCCMKKQDM